MASYYVWSGATGTGTGADWANAYTTLTAAASGKTQGDNFWVAHDHSEQAAAANSPGFPNKSTIYCVNRAGSVPPVSADLRTTAVVGTTGAFNLTITGSITECNGIIFSVGSGSSNTGIIIAGNSANDFRGVNCVFKFNTTSSTSRATLGGSNLASQVILENCSFEFGHLNGYIINRGRLIWKNSSPALTGIIPNTLFNFAGASASMFLEGVDFGPMVAGKNLIDMSSNTAPSRFILKDCKLGGATITGSILTGYGSPEALVNNCDSGDTNTRTEKITYTGTQTTELTIVRTGGASNGTTTYAWKIVTTTQPTKQLPYESLPITYWNENISTPQTVTIQGIWGGGAVPNNDDIWLEAQYLGTSGFPRAVKVSSGKADSLATGAALSAGSGTWGGSTTKFATSVTFTAAEKGPVTLYVKAGLASSTFYIDPKPIVT